MIYWVFAGITVFMAVLATGAKSVRLGILALWLTGLSVGALFLTLGAELLAVVQWIVSTVLAISFVFFAAMFGEYGTTFHHREKSAGKLLLYSLLVGLSFAFIAWFGLGAFPEEAIHTIEPGNDLAGIGRRLVEEHFLSLEVLGLCLFMVLVGGGVIARPERSKK